MSLFIIIVTHNGQQWIEKCFSRLKISCVEENIIIVDNKSSDATKTITDHILPKAKKFYLSENLGFGRANNLGIKYAFEKGAEHILLLNQDVYVQPDTISELIKMLKQNLDYGILSPIHLNGDGTKLDLNFSSYLSPENCPGFTSDIFLESMENKIYEIGFVNAACWLITRNCIETVGGFCPAFFHYCEDDNYIQRCHYHNIKVGIIPNVRIHHDRQNTHKPLRDFEVKYREKLIKYLNPNMDWSLELDLKKRKQLYKKLLIKCNFKYAAEIKKDISFWENKIEFLRDYYSLSKMKGPTFLNS